MTATAAAADPYERLHPAHGGKHYPRWWIPKVAAAHAREEARMEPRASVYIGRPRAVPPAAVPAGTLAASSASHPLLDAERRFIAYLVERSLEQWLVIA